ncbi:ESF1 homolog isoform X2 [Zootermopsis nevadensis]|uniref:ESF1 homolog isoform X2 n=1 Tax=Zootermopsis nevadensis TaxID=136037 RepID=UPI000B8EC6A7|nr:ESF1 homolog isoform X2 [Zootermopsis nevadensis]
MEEIMKDSRFSHIAQDPRFKRIPKREKKIKIDKRFQSMFKDKSFKVNYTVDKRGRPISHTSSEDLKRYYALSSDEDLETECNKNDETNKEYTQISSVKVKLVETGKDGSTSNNINKIKDNVMKDKLKIKEHNVCFEGQNSNLLKRKIDQHKLECGVELNTDNEVPSDEDNKNKEKEIVADSIKKKLRDLTVDYARGEGVLFCDSSSDEESSETGSESEELDHGWGELDHDADQTDVTTNRLAVCHMDWDRIRASDLMVLFSSFVPQGGLIHSVTIYPSEFGLKRMKEEEIKGPLELVGNGNSVQDEKEIEDGEENEEGSKYHMEKLRQYQLNRLKYYYAVLVCDSAVTANKIYTECDGLEYESSATRLDLRFVPDSTKFEEPHEICDRLPDLSKYQPRYFTTTALQQAKVELTWDETNPERNEINQKLMSGQVDGITETDLRDYLASSSEEESDVVVNEELEVTNEVTADPVSKYRALLKGIEQEEEKKKFHDVEMEISWGVGLKDKTEELVQKKLNERKNDLTPFEQYLKKRKDKKKQKKEEKIKNIQQANETSGNEYSDDDIPSDIDMNDQYFKEEFQGEFKKKHSKEKTNKLSLSEDEGTKHKKAELELLLLNEGSEKKHFSLKSIQEQEVEGKKRHKKKGKKKLIKEESKQDDFEVNVQDERFSALFSSHLYNIDPTDSHYHKTKGMEAFRSEKLHRRQSDVNDNPDVLSAKIQKMDTVCGKNPELSLLVETVKRKTRLHKGAR